MKPKKKLFVTVGTTSFPKLVNLFTTKPIIDTLMGLEYGYVQVQTGKDFTEPEIDPQLEEVHVTKENESVIVSVDSKMTIRFDTYFHNFVEEIAKADLIVSHAGAGTCLDVLRRNKKLIVVVNEDLMDNHQIELAETLQNCGYLYYCTCENLKSVLKKNLDYLKEYPKVNKQIFAKYLDSCMGFDN